jgi:hypothetical protein
VIHSAIMAKCAVIAGLILAVVMPANTVATQRPDTKTQPEKPTEAAAKPTVINNVCCGGQDRLEPARRTYWWPDGTTAIAIILTLGAILWQAFETRRAVTASLKQGNQTVTAERAWLVIRPVDDDQSLFNRGSPRMFWRIHNIGKTPARLLETNCLCRFTNNDQPAIGPDPTYVGAPIMLNRRLLAPGESMDFFTPVTDRDGSTFNKNFRSFAAVFLIAYGYIRYLSVLNDDLCESRFCSYFESASVSFTTVKFQPKLDAPPAYTEHT